MVWKQTSDTRWERPLDGLEKYFTVTGDISGRFANGRETYTIFSVVKVELDAADPESALRHAWKQIRHEQPQIATTFEGNNKVYHVPDDKALDEWLASTFIVSSASDAEELHQNVTDRPITQAVLYYLPKSSELVFRGHHHTIDGTGVMLLWDCFLKALASPAENIKFGDETARLAPTMEEVLGFPEQPTQEVSEKATSMFMAWASSIPGIGPVSKIGVAPPGKCQNAEVVLPTKTTEAIVQACKAKGISVTSAIHAAYVGAVVKYADPNAKLDEYVAVNQFNLRPYLPEPYNSSKYAVSVYYSPLPYTLALPAAYDDVARSLQDYYQSMFKKDPQMLELRGHFMRSAAAAVATPEFLSAPVSRDAIVSSLGVAERYMQREYGNGIKVRDFRFGVDVVLSMSMLFVYTFQDQLRLVYSFNDGFEEPADIQKYLEETQEILARELLA